MENKYIDIPWSEKTKEVFKLGKLKLPNNCKVNNLYSSDHLLYTVTLFLAEPEKSINKVHIIKRMGDCEFTIHNPELSYVNKDYITITVDEFDERWILSYIKSFDSLKADINYGLDIHRNIIPISINIFETSDVNG